MKYFIIIALTLTLIQLTKCQDYGDDAGLFSYDEEEDSIDDSPKPIYDIKDAPNLFKKFIKDYKKEYANEKDYNIHFKNFVENLKEINRINKNRYLEFRSFDNASPTDSIQRADVKIFLPVKNKEFVQ
ncbi:hypothetical protein PYW08_016587 [Mythimna loreyi]|uniref:Uncharacterized protein n=1 Tax=Mythimna loreyi TaxID=667449 RepID=A0ACC2QXU6_9NEOP|nr:hypothetical protein PYW08_016587 [Mythimna loreyi]